MKVEIVDFGEIQQSQQEMVACLVSKYTHGEAGESPQMLPVSAEDIYRKQFGLLALTGEIFCGYIGATKPTNHNGIQMPEVGTLWVPRKYRGNEIAQLLVKKATRQAVDSNMKPYAFCNQLSLGIFEKSGYQIKNTEDVPASALSECAKCPVKPASGCCDTIVVYEGTENDNG